MLAMACPCRGWRCAPPMQSTDMCLASSTRHACAVEIVWARSDACTLQQQMYEGVERSCASAGHVIA